MESKSSRLLKLTGGENSFDALFEDDDDDGNVVALRFDIAREITKWCGNHTRTRL